MTTRTSDDHRALPLPRGMLTEPSATELRVGTALIVLYGSMLPFEYQHVPVVQTVGQLMNLVLLLAILRASNVGRFRPSGWLLVFVLTTLLSVLNAHRLSDAATKGSRIVLCAILLVFLTGDPLEDRRAARLRGLRVGLVTGGCAAAALILFTGVAQVRELSDRVTAFGQNENDLAGVLLLCMVLAIGRLTAREGRIWFNALAAALCGATVLKTGSKGAMVAAAATVIVLLVTMMVRRGEEASRRTKYARVIISVLAVTAIGVVIAKPEIAGRAGGAFSELTSTNLSGRRDAWQQQARELQRPAVLLVGSGLGRYSTSFEDGPAATGVPNVTHNTFLNVAVESGLVALFALLMLWRHAVSLALARFRRDAIVLELLALTAVFTMSMSLNWIDRRVFWIGLAIGLGLPARSHAARAATSEG